MTIIPSYVLKEKDGKKIIIKNDWAGKCENCRKDCFWGDGCFECGKTKRKRVCALWCSKDCYELKQEIRDLKAKSEGKK